MTFITKTVRLVAPPEPPFIGTRIVIATTDESPTFGIYLAKLAEGHPSLTVDWGDGSCETLPGLDSSTHTYPTPGQYEIRVSDDVASLRVRGLKDEFITTYPKMLVSFCSDAVHLTELGQGCFTGASLVEIENWPPKLESIGGAGLNENTQLTKVAPLPATLSKLGASAFANCQKLPGEITLPTNVTAIALMTFYGCTLLEKVYLPGVSKVAMGDPMKLPFRFCPSLREIHFAKSNEASITSLPNYNLYPTFGAENAKVDFDL